MDIIMNVSSWDIGAYTASNEKINIKDLLSPN